LAARTLFVLLAGVLLGVGVGVSLVFLVVDHLGRDVLEEKYDFRLIMDNLPQKMCLFFLGLFCSYRKKKQICRRIFFNSSPFSPRKLDLKIQKLRFFRFLGRNQPERVVLL
jgi:hypothetical protein